eukprot:1196073-Rhodomonas_salina.2
MVPASGPAAVGTHYGFIAFGLVLPSTCTSDCCIPGTRHTAASAGQARPRVVWQAVRGADRAWHHVLQRVGASRQRALLSMFSTISRPRSTPRPLLQPVQDSPAQRLTGRVREYQAEFLTDLSGPEVGGDVWP